MNGSRGGGNTLPTLALHWSLLFFTVPAIVGKRTFQLLGCWWLACLTLVRTLTNCLNSLPCIERRVNHAKPTHVRIPVSTSICGGVSYMNVMWQLMANLDTFNFFFMFNIGLHGLPAPEQLDLIPQLWLTEAMFWQLKPPILLCKQTDTSVLILYLIANKYVDIFQESAFLKSYPYYTIRVKDGATCSHTKTRTFFLTW